MGLGVGFGDASGNVADVPLTWETCVNAKAIMTTSSATMARCRLTSFTLIGFFNAAVSANGREAFTA
jgi:hypothetical protein